MAPSYKSTRRGVRIHRRSDLQNHFRCPARHHAEKGLGEGAITNREALERGTWFHACVEAMLKPIKDQKLAAPDPNDALPVLAKVPDSLRPEVSDLLGRWIRRWPVTHVIDVEILLSSEVLSVGESPDGLAHHIGGRLDLVTFPQMIWDWKTGWAVPSTEALQRDLQVCSYPVLASDHYGWTEVQVAVDFPRWGVTRVVDFDLEAIKQSVIRLKEHIIDLLAWEQDVANAKPSEARPGPHCEGCPLLVRCEVAHPEAIRNERDAAQLALAVLQEEHKGARRRELLRDYVAKRPNKAIEAGGAVFELALEGQVTVDDVQALALLLQEHRKDPWPLLKVDTDKLRQFVRKNPHLREQILSLVVDHRTTRLKIRKQ